jgi:hypothetical protein
VGALPAGGEVDMTEPVALLLLLVLLVFLADYWLFPRQACPRCKGKGRFSSSLTGSWRPCPRCGGKAFRIRRGSKFLGRGM